ncbi:MAG: heavy-metal-associated domain-containing protein [Chloroflexi bacterium]|nr:heavy-metal-associated domain-containing protein [Chloroflexota bacterium]MCY3589529.1 heavy-metal-associated domain-containing protein [Chloroflexota bacterium]MCY3685089.1 heavy-metal-associated domain-containing protein [Chloroflexota bacterium]MDE2707743.1 heavy-metal-associated domain-containing protein [Chloroflexota bacterium]MDE2986577.1 heavy-metal-associated domain-containing protein [Chloroflexota bacterium]
MAATSTLTRTAPDISCEHCANAITGALTAIEGVAAVSVDVEEKRVDVEYDAAATTDEQIDAVLEEEGYPPLR